MTKTFNKRQQEVVGFLQAGVELLSFKIFFLYFVVFDLTICQKFIRYTLFPIFFKTFFFHKSEISLDKAGLFTSNFGGSSSALQQDKQLILISLISSANSIWRMNPQSLCMCTSMTQEMAIIKLSSKLNFVKVCYQVFV